MKRKNKIIVLNFAFIICIVLVLTFFYSKSNNNSVLLENAVYALNVNGSAVDEIPARGDYKVEVSCTNSNAKWDYVNWKLNIENVRGNVACTINFESITSTSFSGYIKSLDGTEQGSGKFVHEVSNTEVPDYTQAVALQQSEYGNLTTFISENDAFETSGTAHSGTALTFSNSMWTTNKDIFPNWMFNHFVFDINEDAYYEVCYVYGSGNQNNRLWIYSGESSILESLNAKTNQSQEGCVGVGYVTSDSYIKVVITSISTGTNRPNLSFNIRKVPEDAIETKSVDADYRYEGRNPNNFVWFNDELWRIIGIFDESTHGQTGKELVKIIRHNSLNAFTYNNSASNSWGSSSLKSILNTTYYNGGAGECHVYSVDAAVNDIVSACDFMGIGLQTFYKDMIASVSWKWAGASNGAVSAAEMYEAERTSSKTPVSAYVGLLYASDYGFSALESDCPRKYGLNLYNDASCGSNSWLSGNFWTMSTTSDSNAYAYQIDYNGSLVSSSVRIGAQVRPAIYLDSSVYYIDGDGSPSNPYIIGK